MTITLINQQSALDQFVARMEQEEFITVDTEFMREKTYYAILCLVQIAGDTEAALIDPLAGLDYTRLWHLLHNPKVLKVFHSASQDLEIFLKESGQMPSPIFDSQVAAMTCGYGDSVSYAALVKEIAQANIDKSSRVTDWSQRPLSDSQLEYALADVTHLRTIYRHLAAEIENRGRSHWVTQVMASLTNPATYQIEPSRAWERLKPRSTSPKYLAVFKSLATWREQKAQDCNLPRGRILKDEAIGDLASILPRSLDALSKCRSVGASTAHSKFGDEIIAAVAQGLANQNLEKDSVLPYRNLDNEQLAVVDLLKLLLKIKCEEFQVAPKLIATVSDLEKLALDDNADVAALKDWQNEIFGKDALRLKQGKIAIGFREKALKLIELTE